MNNSFRHEGDIGFLEYLTKMSELARAITDAIGDGWALIKSFDDPGSKRARGLDRTQSFF